MVVIGGGAGGLVTAANSVSYGIKVALVEKNLLGGDCLNTGCVPSKAFLKCANVAYNAKNASAFGVTVEEVKVDFPFIMERMRKIRAQISENDSAERFQKALGVDVHLGHAQFTGPNSLKVNGKDINFVKACISTGGRPRVPDIPNLDKVPYYTSDTIFNLTVQPKRLLIVGAGPIGAELGQAFQRLGTKVTFVLRGNRFLPKEDVDAAEFLLQ
jgi:pyruvate/2-oxoglutarate dehydrogenase complex dihydrolipoamide dehydrogenase (E3) component